MTKLIQFGCKVIVAVQLLPFNLLASQVYQNSRAVKDALGGALFAPSTGRYNLVAFSLLASAMYAYIRCEPLTSGQCKGDRIHGITCFVDW